MAAGLSFKIKGDSTGFVSSVKKAEKSIGSLADKARGAGFGALTEQLRRASVSLKNFSSPKVDVDPIIKDVGKLNNRLKDLSKDKNKVKLQLEAYQAVGDLKKLQDQLKGVLSQRGKVELDANGQQLEKKLIRFKAKLAELKESQSAGIVLDADGRKLSSKVDRLKVKLAEIRERNPGVPLDVNAEKLATKLKIAQGQLDKLKASAPKPVIDTDSSKLEQKIVSVKARLLEIRGAAPRVPLDADGQKLEAKLDRFKAKLSEFQKAESASIVFDADGRKLKNKIDRLKSKLAQMRERNPGVPLDADGKKLESKIKSSQEKLDLLKKSAPKPVIDVDVAKLKSKIKGLDSRLAKLKEASPKIPLDAEGLLLERKLKVYQEKLKNFGKPVPKPVIDLNAEKLELKIKNLNNKIKAMKASSPKIPLTADDQKLVAKIKEAKDKLRSLQSQGAVVNLRLNSKQVTEKLSFIKSSLEKIQNKKAEVKVDLKLKKAGFDLAKKKLQKALTMRGVAKIPGLKGWQKALLMAGVTAYKTAAVISGPLSKGLMLAAHASNKLSVAGNKLNKTLAFVGVAGVKSLKLGLRGIVLSAKLAILSLNKLAAAGRKLVGVGFSKLKDLAFTGIKVGAITATAAVTGLVVAMKKSVEVAASLEQLQVQFTSITGSSDDAADMVSHLRDESKRTGVEIGAMAVMMRRLLASGMDVTEAKKMTASLLDISGALGLTSEESKLLGVALSQVKSKGIASMEELRQQISEKGVEVFKVLEQKLGKKGKELFDMIAAGAVGADVVVDAFMNLEGPLARFRGGTDRMAATFTGSLRRMKAQIVDTFAVFGQPFLAGLSSAMDAVREKVKELEPALKKITDRAGSVVGVLVAAFRGGKLGEMIKLSLIVGGKAMVSTVVAGLKAGFVGASMILKNAFTKITDVNFWKGVADMLTSSFKMMQVAMMEIALMFNPFGREEKEKRMGILQAQSTQEHIRGMDRINDSGNAKPVGEVFIEAGQAMAKIIKDSINDPAMDGTKEQMLLNKLYAMFVAEAKKREVERSDRMNKIVPPDKITTPDNKDKALVKFSKPIVTSLQKIGGASISGGNISVDRTLSSKRNRLLTEVRDQIKEVKNKLGQVRQMGGEPKVKDPKVVVPKVRVPIVAAEPQAGVVASFTEGLRGLSSSINMDGMMNLTREGNGLLRSIDDKVGQQRGAVYV